jgi:rod shape determining protein RodA
MAHILDKPTLLERITPFFQGFDVPLMSAVGVLALIGLINMFSVGFAYDWRFWDHLRNIMIAMTIMFVVAQIPPQRMMTYAVPIYAIGVALLIAVAIFGITKKGAKRWVYVGITIQPSEILKIAMPLMLAWWLDFLVAGLLLFVPVGLIVRQPDLGTAILVFAGGMYVIFFAGLSWRLIAPPVILGFVGIAFIVLFEERLCADGVNWPLLHEYQRQRVCTLLDPTNDPLGKGFHILQGMIAIGSGGIFGKGYFQGTQTHLEFIPERTTDFIFAAFAEEFGLLGCTVLIGTFIFLIMRGLAIALAAPTLFARLLAGAITLIFFTYAFVNMGMVSGILPVVGVPLPFVSYGGTAMVTLGLGVGILMSIAKAKRLVQT